MAREIVTSENREDYIKRKMNPEKEGKVHLEHEDDVSHIFHNGEKVGAIKHISKDNMVQIIRSDVEKEHQHKGIGTQAYHNFIKHHLKQGKAVGSDSTLTRNSANVWEKLKKMGHQVEVSPNAYGAGRYFIKHDFDDKSVDRVSTTDREYRINRGKNNPTMDTNELASGGEPVYTIHPPKKK